MRTEQTLNGFWNFCPITTAQGHTPPSDIPSEWHEIIVPGSWARGVEDPEFEAQMAGKPWQKWDLFNNYEYPAEWDKCDSAWYQRSFEIDSIAENMDYMLHFGGILREAWIFVNGQEVAHSTNGILPVECCITNAVQPGKNEVTVYVTDYRRNAEGLTYTPFGADQMLSQKGIWQDVTLKTIPAVRTDDITIRTSVRQNQLSLTVELSNTSSSPATVTPKFEVFDNLNSVLCFDADPVTIPPQESVTVSLDKEWSDYTLWSQHTPHLYHLQTSLCNTSESTTIDSRSDRFGFREIWIDGPHLMLNGSPLHLSGDWSHRLTMESLTSAFFEKWFGMLKDCNMNYIRTHTFPHPKNLLDMADEQGILISLEAGWHFGSGFALDEEELWQGALQHVRDIIKRDKNHPSIILWSVGNEVRWSGNQPAIIKNVPRLRALYEELDPTRIAYHDGDSSLWDERTQPMLSRHYGLECTGEGWWDKKQPLHVGELGKWHYGQPIDNCIWGNDSVFASFKECHRAIALECADQIEQARANEVCCLFPWNLSGLDNFRPWSEERRFSIDDPQSPGIKIARSAPYGSEFAWWDADHKGYIPGISFNIIKDSLRPIAVIVREKQKHFFSHQDVLHTISVVNDSPDTLSASLQITLSDSSWTSSHEIELAAGHSSRITLKIPLDGCTSENAIITSELKNSEIVLDNHERHVSITPQATCSETWQLPPVAILDNENLKELLDNHGVTAKPVDDLNGIDPAETPILLIGRNTINSGTTQNTQLKQFIEKGGRAIVLEQSNSIMPGLNIDLKPVERCHMRSNPDGLLQDFSSEDFAYWGNDPYGASNSDSWVTTNPYRKDSLPAGQALLHSGAGDFGSDGMFWTPLIKSETGNGLLIASQLHIAEKANHHPVAQRLLARFLSYAAAHTPAATTPINAADSNTVRQLRELGYSTTTAKTDIKIMAAATLTSTTSAELAEETQAGAATIITKLTPDTAKMIADAFDIPLKTVDAGRMQYMLVRADDHPLLYGISNQETCWLQKMQYSKPERKNRPMSQWMLDCPGATELLISENQSCWHEFYLDGACSERLRMPVVSAILADGFRPTAAGMLVIPHGKGKLILSQMPLPLDDEHDVARCFWSQFLANLGCSSEASLLDGECVQRSSMRSQGSPDEFGYITDPDPDTLAALLKTARPTEYRIHNHALVYGFDWQVAEFDDGIFRLDKPAGQVVIAFQIHAGRPRTISYAEDGLPDPTEQTLCNLTGAGSVTPFINGTQLDTIDLGSEQKGVIPDIDLNMDWNTIVLLWQPHDGKSLGILWRNRQLRPEVEFAFMFKNTKFLSGAVHQ